MKTQYFRTIEISNPRFESQGLRHVTVKSQYLNGRGDILFYIPDEFKTPEITPKEKPQAIPVVILLHGVYGSHWAWAMLGGAHLIAKRLIDEKKIQPMILAMPSDGLWGDGSGYAIHSNRNFEKWIVEDVPRAVEAVVPRCKNNVKLFIAGLSMGGYGAIRLGAKYPERFEGISGLSSITRWEEMKLFVKEDIANIAPPKEEQDLITLLHANKNLLPPLRFDCGKADPLIEGNRLLHQQLQDANITHTYEEFDGSHQWEYWEKHLVETLVFFEPLIKT